MALRAGFAWPDAHGAGHAYGNPLTGSGTEASVEKLTREDLVKFHNQWFKPNHATLVIAGDATLAEVTPKLEKLFANWKPGQGSGEKHQECAASGQNPSYTSSTSRARSNRSSSLETLLRRRPIRRRLRSRRRTMGWAECLASETEHEFARGQALVLMGRRAFSGVRAQRLRSPGPGAGADRQDEKSPSRK